MTEEELLGYILSRKYLCPYCQELQFEIAIFGLPAIDDYKGMVCGSIEDMQIRRWEQKTGRKHEPIAIDEDFFA
jgi:hypothetical protein